MIRRSKHPRFTQSAIIPAWMLRVSLLGEDRHHLAAETSTTCLHFVTSVSCSRFICAPDLARAKDQQDCWRDRLLGDNGRFYGGICRDEPRLGGEGRIGARRSRCHRRNVGRLLFRNVVGFPRAQIIWPGRPWTPRWPFGLSSPRTRVFAERGSDRPAKARPEQHNHPVAPRRTRLCFYRTRSRR